MVSTKGILLHSLRYSDSSVIAKIYTGSHGMVPFMVHVGKGKKSASKAVLLQPLTLLEIGFNPHNRGGLKRPTSMERAASTTSITVDTIKTTLAIFIAEMVLKSIQEEEANPRLFQFLWKSVSRLESTNEEVNNFHLKFLVELSGHLGFYPDVESFQEGSQFNLVEGQFVRYPPIKDHYLDTELSAVLFDLIRVSFDDHSTIVLSTEQRRSLLATLIDYYRLHLDGMKEIRSHQILHEVLA